MLRFPGLRVEGFPDSKRVWFSGPWGFVNGFVKGR